MKLTVVALSTVLLKTVSAALSALVALRPVAKPCANVYVAQPLVQNALVALYVAAGVVAGVVGNYNYQV